MREEDNVAQMIEPIEPSDKQVMNCISMGWEYLGSGYFEKGALTGYFTSTNGWVVE